MIKKMSSILLIIVFAVLMTFTWSTIPIYSSQAQLEHPRFLVSPYFGSTYITSWFDHRSPNYTTDNHLLKFTGEERDDPHDDGPGNPPGDLPCEQDTIDDNCYDGHDGIDFGLAYKQVLSSASGIVSFIGWNNPYCHNCGYGLEVEIQHVVNGVTYKTRYGHLSTIAVEPYEYVSARQVIGTSGNTGSSSGPHLHFDIYRCIHATCMIPDDWRAIDPFGWQPIQNADVTIDPWPGNGGTQSWCMWSDGQWVKYCDANQASRPVPTPYYSSSLIMDDNANNTGGFSKGVGNPVNGAGACTGNHPYCQEWWAINGSGRGWLGDAYRTLANGQLTPTNPNWAKWSPLNYLEYGLYEVFVYIPTYLDNNFTWQANYTIVDYFGEEHTALVEYIEPRNRWLSIGVYILGDNPSLEPDSYVYLTDATGEFSDTHCPTGPEWPAGSGQNWCNMLVDAVRFRQILSKIFMPHVIFPVPFVGDPYP